MANSTEGPRHAPASTHHHPSTPPPADPGRIVILGAGPTGLGMAYRLKELGHTNFHIFEKNPYLGGLAHSFTDPQGFTWDIGGHVLFSHYRYYDELFAKLVGEDFTLNDRESWVRMFDRWVPYPFQNNIRYLPKQAAYECLSGLIKAQHGKGKVPSAAAAQNFGEFIDAVFGDGIAKHFMRPYNFKVWAHDPELMNKTWIGERVAVLDVDRALKNVLLEQDDFGWGPNNRFKFPLFGTGDFYDRFGPHLTGHYTLNHAAVAVDLQRKLVQFADGSSEHYDALVSTMPVDILCNRVIRNPVPERIKHSVSKLRHSSGYMVGIGIKRPCPSTKSWMYFPEPNCPFYRVTYLSNYSPRMTPDPDRYYSLLCETSASEFKPVNADRIVEDTIDGLEAAGLLEPGERNDIVSTWVYHADYSYPTPVVERDDALADIIPWLESHSIFSRGRFGMWKYEVANTDHSVMQGVELANRLLLGEPEQTIGLVYKVTEDGRHAADHERPTVAGSGEKRLAVEPKIAAPPGDVDEADVAEEELGVTQKRD